MDRERQARWDEANLRTVSTKLTGKERRALQEACDAAGLTAYAIMKRLLMDWINGGGG